VSHRSSIVYMPSSSATHLDIAQLYDESGSDRYDHHIRYLNEQMVRVLRTIGYDVTFSRGAGQYLYDKSGAKYLDLLSGYGVFAVGRNHPSLRAALMSVLDAELPNLVQMDVSPLAGLLAKRLLEFVPYLDKVFFANSGAEATEAAIKFARRATGRSGILHCGGAFHGLTTGALALCDDRVYRAGFDPLLADCHAVPFNDLAALERALAGREMALFIVEPIQGKGVNMPADGYLRDAAALCRRHGTLFVADEIQTGLGRTGRFLAVEHWGVEPDMVLLAKALSGGHVPVSAVLTTRQVYEKTFDRLDRAVVHGSTYAKNDLAMAAGLATLEVLRNENLIARAERLGERLLLGLRRLVDRYECAREVRGKGLMIGVEFGPPTSLKLKTSWNLIESAKAGLFCQLITIPLFRDHKILTQVAGHASHTVKLLPPLVISEDDCDHIEDAFDRVVAGTERVPGAVWSLGKTLVGNAVRERV
jgi:ornithine--oxo-acid transaminase